MLSNDNKKKEDVKEAVTIDEVLKEDDKNIINEKGETVNKREKDGKVSFLRRLEAVVIDQLIIGAVSYILLLLLDLILRFGFGFFVNDMLGMYLTIFIVMGIVYPLICGGTKGENTPGRIAAGLGPINN